MIRALCAVVLVGLVAIRAAEEPEPMAKAEYERAVRDAYDPVRHAFAATNVPPGAELANRVAAAQAALRRAAETLEALSAPRAVAAENRRLVDGMRAYADELNAARAAAAQRDAAALAEANETLGRSLAVEGMAEAAEEMTHAGYDLGRIAEE